MEFNSTESNKLVGARKRKPVNISKISSSPSSPPNYEEENDQAHSPCSSTRSRSPVSSPGGEPNNNKIQSILSELKFAKQRTAPHQIVVSQQKRVVSPPLLGTTTPSGRAAVFNANHFAGGGLLMDMQEKSFNMVPTAAHAHAQSRNPQVTLQDEPLDLSVDAVDLRKNNNGWFNMLGMQGKSGSTTNSQQKLLSRVTTLPSPPPSPQPNIPMDLTRSNTSTTRTSPPSFMKKEELQVSSSFGSPPSSIGSNAAVEQEQRAVRKYQKRKESSPQQQQQVAQTPPGVKPKQRRYRTERPFHCPHCPARFTLRSNMERHGKHQHASVWQRSPSNRVLNKQRALQQQQASTATSSTSPSSPPSPPQSNVRMLLSHQLKRKLSSIESADLASVETLLEKTGNEDFKKFFRSMGECDEDEEDAIDEYDDERFREDYYEEDDQGSDVREDVEQSSRRSLRSNNNNNNLSGKVVGSSGAGNNKVQKSLSAYSSAPHKISCPHCTRKFPWTSSLRRHLLTHTGQKPFQCGHCPLLFTTKSNCDRHVARKHNSESNAILRGKLSEKTNNNETGGTKPEDEDEDEEVEEEEEEDDDDDYDGMVNKIGEKDDVKGSVVSGGGASFRCHLCELSSPVRSTILKHIEASHGDNFALLDVVGCNSNQQQSEDQDESTESNNVTNRKVLCAFCIRRFWSVEDLRRHMRSHTGERPFSCQFCSRRFTLKHSMLRHLKKHNDLK